MAGFWKHALWLSAVLAAVRSDESNPCEHHHVISEGKRSISYQPDKFDYLLCDKYSITSGQWYRFQHRVGGTMPESCVDKFHCGTQAPIWMNGHHPTVRGTLEERQVCANFGEPGDCCTWSAMIEVMRCDDPLETEDFFVYKLQMPPGCSIAYCAGDRMPCPDDLVYNNRTQTCTDPFPTLTNASLHDPVVEGKRVQFYCEVAYDLAVTEDNGGRYEVTFYFDHVIHEDATIIMRAPKRRVAIDEKYLRFNLGKSLSCAVRAFWEGYPSHKSEAIHSNSYFVGILVEPNHVIVSEKDDIPQEIVLKSTLPITCKDPDHMGRCEITVRVVTPTRLVTGSGTLPSYLQCMSRITRESWKEPETLAYNLSEPLEVTVKRDPMIRDASSQFIKFEPMPLAVPYYAEQTDGSVTRTYSIWDLYQLPDVKVDILEDAGMATCHSTSDPRIRTWDNGGYDILHRIGEFVLWRSASHRVFEVHIRHWMCREAWFVSCTCGVAVREGNVVLAVDMCGGRQKSTPRPKVTQISKGGPRGASVTRDKAGRTFSINMPSGAYVKMDVHDWGMNVYSYAPSEDVGKTSGLCGTFDGDKDNDFVIQTADNSLTQTTDDRELFLESWRIPRGTSLFDKEPEWLVEKDGDLKYCDCNGGRSIVCDWSRRVDPENDVGKPSIPINPLKKKNQDGEDDFARRKRGLRVRRDISQSDDTSYTDDIDDEEDSDFDYGLEQTDLKKDFEFPTDSGITEKMAKDRCLSTLRNASSYADCSQVLGSDVEEPLDRCIDDIKMMDDMTWAANIVHEMENLCLHESQTSGGTNGKPDPREVIKYICPDQCNNRGKCVNGECVCDKGYEGADCSLMEGQIPIAKYIPNDGLCDITQRPCLSVRVVATGIKDSPSLVCRVVQVEIQKGGRRILQDSSVISNATMITANEVACDLPRSPVGQGTPDDGQGVHVHGMRVSISNDGVHFSKVLTLTIYDSTCLTSCSDIGNCGIKFDSCRIKGHCFAKYEPNPNNWCHYCNPQMNMFNFSQRTDNQAPEFVTSHEIKKVPTDRLVMQLKASDPESRPVTFIQGFTTNDKVFVNENGTLVWPVTDTDDIRVEVTVRDECGLTVVENFLLMHVPCDCTNGGSCVPDPAKPLGRGHYMCACAPGYTGALCEFEIDECASDPCLHGTCKDLLDGFHCDCFNDYQGVFCDELPSLPGLNGGRWGEWGPWNDCSQSCDYGIHVRTRECMRVPCAGLSTDTKLCGQTNCPEKKEETPQGAILIMSNSEVAQLRLYKPEILDYLAIEFNQYCRENYKTCCSYIADVSTSQQSDVRNVVTKDNFHYATGYPRIHSNTQYTSLKIIGMIDKAHMRAMCSGEASEPSTPRDFIPTQLLTVALIEADLSVWLVDVVNVVDADYNIADTYSAKEEDDGSLLQKMWLLIFGAAAGGLLFIILIVLITVCLLKRARRRANRGKYVDAIVRAQHHRSNSTKGLTNNEEMDEKDDTEGPAKDKPVSPSAASSVRDKFFFEFTDSNKRPGNKGKASEEEVPKGSLNDKYFYKLAVHDGLPQIDNIDSSTINLHTPSECDYDSFRGISAHSMAVQFNPTGGEGGENDDVFAAGSAHGRNQIPRRLSTKKSNKMFAWKLFNGKT